MDIKTLLAGFRPLLPHEVNDRVRVLSAAIGGSTLLSTEAVVAALPKDLLAHRFGSGGFDAETTRAFALLHGSVPIPDVFWVALLNQLVMQLTYQGRHIHHWRPPEAAAFVGTSPEVAAYAMLNAGRVLGMRIKPATVTDEEYGDIVSAAARVGLAVGEAPCRTPDDVGTVLNMENRDLGLLVIDGLDHLDVARGVITSAAERHVPATFTALRDEAHRIAKVAAHLRQRHPNASVSVRYYARNGNEEEQRGLAVLSGLSHDWSADLDVSTRAPVRFVASFGAEAPALTDGRIDARLFGEAFRGGHPDHPGYERVVVKPPLLMRSSAPVPHYSRAIIEDPVLVSHRVAVIKGGGVVFSRDPEHATYFYVSSAGEVVSDIIEVESFYRSPLYRTATRDGDRLVSSTIARKHIRKIKGPAIPLCFAPNAHEYHSHFLLQCFPRILIARELCPDATILVPHDLRRYQRDMLRLVGVPDDKTYPIRPDTVVYCDELYVPDLWPAIFNGYGARIYDELIAKAAPRALRPHRRIMISRAARQTWRNLVNFSAVSQVLEDEFGFEVVTPDKLDLLDEIQLFRESQIIAGAEGAGLYNCCFSSPNSAVLNFADQDYVMYIVGSMAALRGFDVGYVFGESFIADTDLGRRGGHSDFVIDPALVRSAASELIERLAG